MTMEMAPSVKLYAAISILQSHILAQQSELVPAVLFGTLGFKNLDLELVERLLRELMDCVETGEEAMEKAAKDD